jgi:hypothetical protein
MPSLNSNLVKPARSVLTGVRRFILNGAPVQNRFANPKNIPSRYFALHHCDRKLSWIRHEVQRRLGARPATPRSTTADQLGVSERSTVVRAAVSSHIASSGMKRRSSQKSSGELRRKSARWVLLGETSSRSHARSVRALARKR